MARLTRLPARLAQKARISSVPVELSRVSRVSLGGRVEAWQRTILRPPLGYPIRLHRTDLPAFPPQTSVTHCYSKVFLKSGCKSG